MNNKSGDANGNSFMLIIGIIVGFLTFSAIQYGREWFMLLIIALNAVLALYSYHFFKSRNISAMRGIFREVVENIRFITVGGKVTPSDKGFFSEEINELYKTVETLNKSLITQNSSKDNVINIINSIALNIELDALISDMLPKLIEGTKSNWGAFYLYNSQSEKMELKSSQGFTKNVYKEFDISLGDGFVGVSAQTDNINVITDIPEDTIYISRTFLGKIKPRSIMTVPIRSGGETLAVLLLASVHDYTEEQLEIAKLLRYYMASAVTNGLTYERTKRLKNELTFQNRLIQNMNEELETKVERRTMFWSNIINSISEYALVALDEEGYIQMWNKGAEIIRGFTEKEVLGKHISDAYVGAERDEPLERLKLAKKEGKSEDYCWMTKKDGSVIFAHRIVTAIYSEQNELIGYTTIIRDITTYNQHNQLEDSDTYYSFLFNFLLSNEEKGFVMLNRSGVILNLSPKAAEVIGYSITELNGAPFRNYLENGKDFAERLSACLGGDCNETWNDILCGSNREITLSISGTDIPGADEKILIVYLDGLGEAERTDA